VPQSRWDSGRAVEVVRAAPFPNRGPAPQRRARRRTPRRQRPRPLGILIPGLENEREEHGDGLSVAQKLIESHLVEGEMTPGGEIGLRIDQTLTQDATGHW
jgi:hypothetical protein